MTQSEDRLKKAADLKLWMETRIAELQEEVERLKEALVMIDSVLRASSFKSASEFIPQVKEPGEEAPEIAERRDIRRDRGGDVIARAAITTAKIVVEPTAEVTLRVETPPFKSFLLGKILTGMKTKDDEFVAKGKLKKGDEIRYQLAEKNGRIERITIHNYRDKDRLSELLSTLGWTFSRMLEKG